MSLLLSRISFNKLVDKYFFDSKLQVINHLHITFKCLFLMNINLNNKNICYNRIRCEEYAHKKMNFGLQLLFISMLLIDSLSVFVLYKGGLFFR